MNDYAHDTRWIQRLARGLVGEHAAEDVVQETWLKLRDRSDVRAGYVARVARSLALHRLRGDGRRARREARSSRDGALPSAAEVASRTEVTRALSRALDELDEPYKTTLVLRYYDDLSAAEIARRAGLPAATVRARVKRGLDTLRARLDDRAGGRASWLPALLPLARIPVREESRALAATGGFSGVSKVGLALLLAASGTWIATRFPSAEPAAQESWIARPDGTPVPGHDRGTDTSEARATSPGARAALGSASATASRGATESEVSEATALEIAARLVDAAGEPLPGGWLRFRHAPDVEAHADDDGRITLASIDPRPTTEQPLELWIGARGRQTRLFEWTGPARTLQLGDVVLEPGGTLRGRVVDETGVGVAGAVVVFGGLATISYRDPERGPPELYGNALSSGARTPLVGASGPSGAFELDGLAPGHGTAWARTPTGPWVQSEPIGIRPGDVVTGLELVVVEAPERAITGRVVDPAGRPVAGIPVRISASSGSGGWDTVEAVETDVLGAFHYVPIDGVAQDVRVPSPVRAWRHAERLAVPPGTHDLTIAFEPSGWLAFEVTDEAGRVVRDGDIRAVPREGRTDHALGRCESALDAGRLLQPTEPFRLLVVAPGFRNMLVGPFDPADVPAPVTVRLAAAPAIHGRVLLPDGRPASGARVSLHRGPTPSSGNLAPGQQRSEGVPHLSHQGWTGDRDAFVYELFVEPTAEVRTAADGTFRLTRPGLETTASGEVAGPSGLAALGYAGTPSELQLAPARNAEPERPWFVHASLPGHASWTSGPHRFEGTGDVRLDLELPRGGAIAGRLELDGPTSPLGWTMHASDGRAGTAEAAVATDGSFRFEALHPGGWQVRAFEPGRRYWPSGGRLRSEREPEPDVVVEAGRTTEYVHVTRVRETARLCGELLLDGRPAGAWLAQVRTSTPQAAIQSDRTSLDPDGRFAVALEPGLSTSLVLHGDGLTITVEPTIHAGRNDWSLDVPTALLAGRIDPDRVSGPVTEGNRALFSAITYQVETGTATIQTRIEPDENGRFGSVRVAAGHGILLGQKPDWRSPAPTWMELELAPGETRSIDVRH